MMIALEATSKLAAAIARCAVGEVRKVEVLVMMFSWGLPPVSNRGGQS
jgi:hypothetical protein